MIEHKPRVKSQTETVTKRKNMLEETKGLQLNLQTAQTDSSAEKSAFNETPILYRKTSGPISAGKVKKLN